MPKVVCYVSDLDRDLGTNIGLCRLSSLRLSLYLCALLALFLHLRPVHRGNFVDMPRVAPQKDFVDAAHVA